MSTVIQDQCFQKPFMFVQVVTAAQDSANAAVIQVCPYAPDTRDFIFIGQVLTSAGLERAATTFVYSKTTGQLTVENAALAENDIITILGNFGTIA